MKKVFGIDLGTTYSCIAYMDEYNKPIVLKNCDGELTTPSVVFMESENNVIVGMEAKRSVEIEPDRTVQFIKRKIGKENDTVLLAGKRYTAPEISAYILKKLVKDANDELHQSGVLQEGEEIKDVVITCPAYFGMNEKQATKTAGELAGLNVLNIINEPTAAAISYGASASGKNETILVYDLGGGTFDITVMNVKGSEITVICTGGDDQLGGKDWDEAFMDYIVQRYEEEYGEDLSEDQETVAALYGDVEMWKTSLTAREKVNITVNGPAGRFREEFTRKQFEEITVDLLSRTKNLLDDVLRTAEKQGYPLKKIDKILLVGGSSKMPQVAAMLERDYQVQASLQEPNVAVAKGAAIYAQNEAAYQCFVEEEAAKQGKTTAELVNENFETGQLDKKYAISSSVRGNGLKVVNVLSRTYGMSTLCGDDVERICNMLMINDKLPATIMKPFYTLNNNQSGLRIEIYESRSTEEYIEIEDRKPLTVIEMDFVKPVPKDTPVHITFALDNSGMLHVMGEEQLFYSKLDTTFSLSNQMSSAEKSAAGNRLDGINVE